MSLSSPSSFRTGVLFALVAALGFAAKGILIKWAYASGVPSESLLSLRMCFASAILAAVHFIRTQSSGQSGQKKEKLSPGSLVQLIALGFCGYYLSSYLDFKGLELLPASIERLILLLYPTFTVVLTAVLLRKPQPALVWIALPVCYLGLFLVLGNPSALEASYKTGVLLVFGSTISYALYLVFSPSLI
ncbi:MAG: DMT family transporter, partial [Spirochaetia bacterium]|nr:DMT family transporter [Spirochaetia bacterium]